MKTLRITPFALAAFALLMALTAVPVAADVDPHQAPYADAQSHLIPANSSQWYRFEYVGDNSVVTIRVPLGNKNRLAFEIYTPEEVAKWWDTRPIGAGSPQKDDLVWAGRFNFAGTFYVEILNRNPYAISYVMEFTGKGASFTPPVQVPAPAMGSPVSAVKVGTNTDPTKAISAVNAKGQFIPAKSTLWYKYNYAGGNSSVLINVANGNTEHLRMHVHTPEQMQTWWDTRPVGQGNPIGDDLNWYGGSCECGSWFVEVVNDNPYGVYFDLTLTGEDVW
jgi:hypothetical protein